MQKIFLAFGIVFSLFNIGFAQFETQLERSHDNGAFFYLTIYPHSDLVPFYSDSSEKIFVRSFDLADFDLYQPVLTYLRKNNEKIIPPELVPDNFGQKLIVSIGKSENLGVEFIYNKETEEKDVVQQFIAWQADELPMIYAKNVRITPNSEEVDLKNITSSDLTQKGIRWVGKMSKAVLKNNKEEKVKIELPIAYVLDQKNTNYKKNKAEIIPLDWENPNGYQSGKEMMKMYYKSMGKSDFYIFGKVWGRWLAIVLAILICLPLGVYLWESIHKKKWKRKKKSEFMEELPLSEIRNTLNRE